MSSRGIRANKDGTGNLGGDITGSSVSGEEKFCLDVIQHAHEGNGMIHFVKDGILATQDLILIDISDTDNYPHLETGFAHIAWFNFQVDASSDADYIIQIGFLENVDDTNGDFSELFRVSGTRKAGNNKAGFFPMSPQGPSTSSGKLATSIKSLNDTAFQTDVNLASTLDPGTADTPSGDGDMVARVTIAAGTINLNVQVGYHGH